VTAVLRLPISCVGSMAISCNVPAVSGKWVEDVCAGQIGIFIYLVLCCLVGCCTWFSCCAANVGLSICVWYCYYYYYSMLLYNGVYPCTNIQSYSPVGANVHARLIHGSLGLMSPHPISTVAACVTVTDSIRAMRTLFALPRAVFWSRVYASVGRPSVRLSTCLSQHEPSRRYRSIAARRTATRHAAGECGQCHVVSVRSS